MKCEVCLKTFTTKSNYLKHLRKFHSGIAKPKDYTCKIRCPDCSENFVSHSRLEQHIQQYHYFNVDEENISFASVEDFKQWKNEIELDTSSLYTCHTGSKWLTGNRKRKYYECHRSYLYEPTGSGERKLKSTGTNKIGSTCPSRMEVTYDKGKVNVKFKKNHLGHETDVSKLRLQKSTRDEIAGKLLRGMTIDEILGEIRDSTSSDTRMALIGRQDVRNIIRDYRISYGEERGKNDHSGNQVRDAQPKVTQKKRKRKKDADTPTDNHEASRKALETAIASISEPLSGTYKTQTLYGTTVAAPPPEPSQPPNLCRICARSRLNFVPIYGDFGEKFQLAYKLNKYLPIKISENDRLPLVICRECFAAFTAYLEMVEHCSQAEKKLMRVLGIDIVAEQLQKVVETVEAEWDQTRNGAEETVSDPDACQSEPIYIKEPQPADIPQILKKRVNPDRKARYGEFIIECNFCKYMIHKDDILEHAELCKEEEDFLDGSTVEALNEPRKGHATGINIKRLIEVLRVNPSSKTVKKY